MEQVTRLWRDFWNDPWQARFTIPLIVINAVGSACGYYWYHEQLAGTPLYYWPFVPDSPLSTTLFAVALLLSLAGSGSILYRAVALTASIKYGIWAIVMISHYWLNSGPLELTEAMLWLSHYGSAGVNLPQNPPTGPQGHPAHRVLDGIERPHGLRDGATPIFVCGRASAASPSLRRGSDSFGNRGDGIAQVVRCQDGGDKVGPVNHGKVLFG